MILNFGPQHPAAHGVLRLLLQLEGEIIQKVDIHIGLLHRGTEYLITQKHYEKSIPYFDRLDYVSMMSQEHSFCLAIEDLLYIKTKQINVDFIRILFDELTRIMNHLLAIACHALDVGSMSALFWAFEEREKLYEFYESVSGARMHAAYHKPSINFSYNVTKQLLINILYFVNNCFKTLNEMHNLLSYNTIWKQRLVNIGTLTPSLIQQYNLTGIMARSVGIKRDLRISYTNNYSSYNKLNFKSFISLNGDTYDRYLLRMFEMGESLNIITFLCTYFLKNNNIENLISFNSLTTINKYTSMEDLINHFLQWHTGIFINKNISTTFIESPKGEFGLTLLSNNNTHPTICKIKSPSYYNLQILPILTKGHYLADLAALIGTIDIVFGEIDRSVKNKINNYMR